MLYVPVASYCDAPDRRGVPAEGRLVAIDVTQPSSAPDLFDPVPGPDNLGGVWGWGGVSVSLDGDALYTGVGNAEPDVDNGDSDSMVELSSDLSETFGVNRPLESVDGEDVDIGAAPVLFKPAGCPALLAANDKSGQLIVWRQDALAHGPSPASRLSDGVDAFVGAPSWSPRDADALRLDRDGDERHEAPRRHDRPEGHGEVRVHEDSGSPPPATDRSRSRSSPATSSRIRAAPTGGFVVERAGTGVVVWRYPDDGAERSRR